MSQFALFLLIYCVGLVVCVAIGPTRRVHLWGGLGFLTGLAVFVALEILFLGLRLPISPLGFGTGLVVITAACVARIVWHRPPLTRHDVLALAAWALGFGVIAFVLSRVNFVIMSYDSHYLVMMGSVIAHDGAVTSEVLQKLGDYGIFQVISMSFAGLTRKSYLWALPPVVAASTMLAFAILLGSGLDALGVRMRRRWAVIALITVATFSMFMLFRHALYIQTNFGTAAYLLVFCVLVWLATVEKDTSLLPLAFIALFAVALHRIEGPIIAALFAALGLLTSRLPARAVLAGLASVAIAVAGWYLLLASAVSPRSEFLTPNRCYLMASVLIVFTAYYAVSHLARVRFLERVNQVSPLLIAIVIGLALVAAFALRFDHMATSAEGWLRCLHGASYWKGATHVTLLLALLALTASAPPHRWMFVAGIPLYLAIVLLLVLNRTPYYFGLGDSATRMTIHVLPIAWLYFGLTFTPLLNRKS